MLEEFQVCHFVQPFPVRFAIKFIRDHAADYSPAERDNGPPRARVIQQTSDNGLRPACIVKNIVAPGWGTKCFYRTTGIDAGRAASHHEF
jgi:hypothetical protein